MNKLNKTLALICMVFISNYSVAQTETTAVKKDLSNGTVAEQFDYVIENSNRYQSFKVIKKEWMYTLKQHVKDTLKSFHEDIAELNADIKIKKDRISDLENSLGGVEANLTSVSSEKDNINFMGTAMTKAKYKSLMWSVIAGLGALFVFFLFKFKSSNSITKSVKNDLSQLQIEFSDHKKSALLREQELGRKLQDELNKVN